MIVHYHMGYAPEKVLDIVKIVPATYLSYEYLELVDIEDNVYDATELYEECDKFIATLPENW